MATSSATSSAPYGGRGIQWQRLEILDLLDIWGEQQVQKQLAQSHRNREVFEIVARRMAARGHRRTAEECRSKSKTLRLEYQRVVAHNAKSGSDRRTCPFYEQLNAILHGNARVVPKRLVKRLHFLQQDRKEAGGRAEAGPSHCPIQPMRPPSLASGLSADLFADDLHTTDIQSHLAPVPEEKNEDEIETIIEESHTHSECLKGVPAGSGQHASWYDFPGWDSPSQTTSPVFEVSQEVDDTSEPTPQGTGPEEPREEAPQDDKACLSPVARLKLLRDKRPRATQRTDHLRRKLLEQADQHHRALMQQLAEDRRAWEAHKREAAEEKRRVLDRMSDIVSVFREMVGGLNRLTDIYERSVSGGTSMAGAAAITPQQFHPQNALPDPLSLMGGWKGF